MRKVNRRVSIPWVRERGTKTTYPQPFKRRAIAVKYDGYYDPEEKSWPETENGRKSPETG